MDISKILKDNFICKDEIIGSMYNRINAPLFRKDFVLNKNIKNAKLYICGLGLYELFINGKNITKGHLAPYFSNPNHLVYYDVYDITNDLTSGGNAIGVLLGYGIQNPLGGKVWGFDRASWIRSERLSLILEIDNDVFLLSDESFYVKPSHIMFNDLRCGEYVDSRLYNQNDYLYGNIDNTFKNVVKTDAPKGNIVLNTLDHVHEIDVKKPISVKKVDDGYIYDFGENLAGIPRFKIKGHPGQVISLWHFEATLDGTFYNKNTCTPDADRYMSQKDILICSGNDDYFEPYFTYHGFRYIYLEGSENIPCSLEMVILSSLDNPRASLICSNEIINKIQHMTINSDLSNFINIPTDCPQREKNGWTGDASLSCLQFLYNFDCNDLFKVWLDNIRCAQKDDGCIPGVVPTDTFGYDWGNGPVWDSVLVELPYNIYKFSGDTKIIEDTAEAIYKYLSIHLQNKINKDGLFSFGLCDWCEAGSILEYVCSTPIEVTDTLEIIDMLSKSIVLFKKVNDDNKIKYCKDFKEKLISNFRKKWLDDDMYISCKTQTAQAFAIKVGIFSKDEIKKAVDNLVSLIKDSGDVMKVGVVGCKYIFDVLTENGYGNLAIKLITQNKFPSFNYWIINGATSLWEAFNELEDNKLIRKDGGRVLSLNHHFWGTISAYFYKYIAGLDINPNLDDENEIRICPYYFDDIDYVKCNYKNKENEIDFEIRKINGKLNINIINNRGFKII